jgi:hypothetical protein
MIRLLRLALSAALLTALLPFSGHALKPLPVVLQGQGYHSWMAPEDAKTWRMERLLYELRQKDEGLRTRALKQLGFGKQRFSRTLMWRQWIEPIQVEEKWLGFERRTMAVLWAPYDGKLGYAMVVFVRDGIDPDYWKPWQLFEFDTDPAQGLKVEFPDILDDKIYYLSVRHMVKDDIYGNRQVITLFKDDERGGDRQMLPVWQETDEYFRSGKFAGDPWWLSQKLTYGNQRIEREVTVKHYTYTKRGEEVRYLEAPYDGVKSTETMRERFSWNPADFHFYDAVTELEKLVRDKHPEIRSQAARRLGFLLSTTHPQIEKAMLGDQDARVRIHCALALASIGDPAALPSVQKGLDNTEEDDTVKEALEAAQTALQAASEARAAEAQKALADAAANTGAAAALSATAQTQPIPTPQVSVAKPKKKRAKKPVAAPADVSGTAAVTEPKINLRK